VFIIVSLIAEGSSYIPRFANDHTRFVYECKYGIDHILSISISNLLYES